MPYKFEKLDVWQPALAYPDTIYRIAEQARFLGFAIRSLIEFLKSIQRGRHEIPTLSTCGGHSPAVIGLRFASSPGIPPCLIH
jgi:hypothetical protein